MEINELLNLETFPKSYEVCFLESCSVKENCLHHSASFQHMGRSNLSLGTYA